MDVKELLNMLKANLLLLILFPAAIVAASAYVSWFVLPVEYTCEMSIYVIPNSQSPITLDDENIYHDYYDWYHEMVASQQVTNDTARLVESARIRSEIKEDVGLSSLDDYKIEVDASDKNRVIIFKVSGQNKSKVCDLTVSLTKRVANLTEEVLDVKSVSIIDKDNVEAYESGPHRLIILLVAFAVSLFIAILIVWFKDVVNQKLRDSGKLVDILGVPLLAEMPKV